MNGPGVVVERSSFNPAESCSLVRKPLLSVFQESNHLVNPAATSSLVISWSLFVSNALSTTGARKKPGPKAFLPGGGGVGGELSSMSPSEWPASCSITDLARSGAKTLIGLMGPKGPGRGGGGAVFRVAGCVVPGRGG